MATEPVDPATGGEPPLVPAAEPEPEAPPRTDARVEEALRPLRERVQTDGVLAAEVAAFLDAEWRMAGPVAVQAEVGQRFCRVTPEQVEIGHLAWPGSKRIPL